MPSTACWKKLWLTVTGDARGIASSQVQDVLKTVKLELLNGLLYFKPYIYGWTTELDSTIKEKGINFECFIQQLGAYINLEPNTTWKVFCNYLIFEYYGKIEDIQQISEYELFHQNMFRKVHQFYESERMYMLKTLKHILEKAKDQKYKFHKLYYEFLNELTITAVRSSLFKQLDYLVDELKQNDEKYHLDFKELPRRNNREQLEVLHMLILTVDYKWCSIEEFILMLDIYLKYKFVVTNDDMLEKCYPKHIKINTLTQLSFLILATKKFWVDYIDWQICSAEIENQIERLVLFEETSILLLLFIDLQLVAMDAQGLDTPPPIYEKYIRLALAQKVFWHIYELLLLPNWKDCRAGYLIKEAVYGFVSYTSTNFEQYETALNFDGFPDLIAELAKEPKLAMNMIKPDDIYYQIYMRMFETFPYSFVPFSKITAALLYHDEVFNFVFSKINNFEMLTELYEADPYDCEVTTCHDYNPKTVTSITIPAGTKAFINKILDTSYITFKYHYSYFDILGDRIKAIVSESDTSREIMYCVNLGYRCIEPILQNTQETETKYHPVIYSLNLIQTMILKASIPSQMNFDLIATCLDVYTLFLHKYADKITDGLVVSNFLPHIIKDTNNINNFFEGDFMNNSLILHVMQEEVVSGKIGILLSYIDFLKQLVNLKKCSLKVLAPGMVFLFVQVFPYLENWNLEIPTQKLHLVNDCLGLMLKILQNDYNQLQGDELIIYNFCLRLVADYVPVIVVLNRFFRMTNIHLNVVTMEDSNWDKRSSVVEVQCLKKVLTITNILLSLHNRDELSLSGTQFLMTLLNSDIKPSSLKILTGYMQHTLDLGLPKLACLVLNKLAVNSDVSMFSLLEMDKYQLQWTFLEKLRDPLEDDGVKLAILDLITLCIQKQSGMIVAFFGITELPSSSENIGDNVGVFMEEYLANIRKSTDYLYSPIQAAILDLFHALWLYRKNLLIAGLSQMETFWTALMDPLFKDLKLPQRTYSQIFNILTYELFCSEGMNTKINLVIEKLFSSKENYTDTWCKHVLTEVNNPQLVYSWKDLLVATLKHQPDTVSDLTRQLLAETCLDGLNQHYGEDADIRFLSAWAEIYLFLINHWPAISDKHRSKVLSTLTNIFKHPQEFCLDINGNLVKALLSISVKTVKDLHIDNPSDALVIEGYLKAIAGIFEKEYLLIVNCKITDIEDNKILGYSNWLLLITFGRHLLETQLSICQEWFQATQFLSKVLKSIRPFTQSSLHFSIAKVIIQCLVTYLRSPLGIHFLYADLDTFLGATLPPKQYMDLANYNYQNAIGWHFEDWWLTYRGVVQLMTLLLQKFGRLILDKMFSFALMHEDVIRIVMRLPIVTAELTALQLVQDCLNFIHLLLKWQKDWKLNFIEMYFSYMDAINETINVTASVILRPAILKVFIVENEINITPANMLPTSCLVKVINDMMLIVAYSCRCLLRVCPSMITLLEPYQILFSDDVDIEYTFNIPKLHDQTASQLKYGTLLCLVHFLCKSATVGKCMPGESYVDLEIPFNTRYLIFVCQSYFRIFALEKYSSLQTFAAPEVSTLWLAYLDQRKVTFTLETLTTFLAVQIFLTTYVRPLTMSQVHHIKRELCSEMLYYQEFIRKQAVDQYHYKTVNNFVFRKPSIETIPYLTSNYGNEIFVKVGFYYQPSQDDLSASTLRIGDNLGNADDDQIFYNKDCFNLLTLMKTPPQPPGYKTFKTRPRYHGRTNTKDVIVEKVALSYPSEYCIHEQGDYLLMLSHWFFHICELCN